VGGTTSGGGTAGSGGTAGGGGTGGVKAFPTAIGFGAKSVGGRGGVVYKVTNLNDAGSGSLRACAEASEPRVCVFEVSGTIDLASIIKIKSPYLTIAGQTAPSPGVFVRYNDIEIAGTHDVVIQHIAVGPGDYHATTGAPLFSDADGISVRGPSHSVILDHVSIFFGIDQVGSIYLSAAGAPKDVTIQSSIAAYPLHDSIHFEGVPHAKGILVGPGSERISLIGNIIAHSIDRNPKLTGVIEGEVLNNVIYNWGNDALEFEQGKDAFGIDVPDEYKNVPVTGAGVGNVFSSGANQASGPISIGATTTLTSSVHLADNSLNGAVPGDPWSSAIVKLTQGATVTQSPSFSWGSGAPVLPSAQTLASVLATAGAHPAKRHAMNQRVVDEVVTKSGQVIDCVKPTTCANSFGGWPVYPSLTQPLQVPPNPGGDDDKDGYTNLEEWLHEFSAAVE
jgi:hypothetical protein